MKFRWSNGSSAAVEFSHHGDIDTFANVIESAMLTYRSIWSKKLPRNQRREEIARIAREYNQKILGYGGARDRLELHVESDVDHWVDPVFPPRPGAPVIHLPGLVNGQEAHDGIVMSRRTHVINHDGPMYGGHPPELVMPAGYSPTPEPQLCGVYWNDWVLKIGPGFWHAKHVYDACLAAIHGSNQFRGFIGDVVENLPTAREGEE